MRDLFGRLNYSGIEVDLSTFSKACKTRQGETSCRFYDESVKASEPSYCTDAIAARFDSNQLNKQVILGERIPPTLTVKWHQFRAGQLTECLIYFGQRYDARFAESANSMIAENGVGVMDRGFANWEFLDELSTTQTRFVVRIKNTMKTEFEPDCYRVVWFCDERESQ